MCVGCVCVFVCVSVVCERVLCVCMRARVRMCVCVCVCVWGGVNVFVSMYSTDYSASLLQALSAVLLDDRSGAS